jgi:glutamate--cysteine ligase
MNSWNFDALYELFSKESNIAHVRAGLHGLEKESLRVNTDGTLALTPHPEALGDSLTNAEITTDFSESQLELITPPCKSIEDALEHLHKIHEFTVERIGDERIWPFSMPAILPESTLIPIARYGDTEEAKQKELYREGLAARYGKQMQMLCGVHYNFSFSIELWKLLAEHSGAEELQSFINESYLGLVRNFVRHRWILIFLFGASPVYHPSYECKLVKDKQDAIALRMSRCGYANSAKVHISYNNFEEHIADYQKAVDTPYPKYKDLSPQLNDHILQIANEYYFPIRLKPGTDLPLLEGLQKRGVQYIEVRLFDLNPLVPSGVTQAQLEFTHAFLLMCLMEESPPLNIKELKASTEDQQQIAMDGRHGLPEFEARGEQLFEKLHKCAELLGLDLKPIHRAFKDPKELLANRILEEMGTQDYIEFGMKLSEEHFQTLNNG